MDDHEMDDTVESLSMKFGLRYANLGRSCRPLPAARHIPIIVGGDTKAAAAGRNPADIELTLAAPAQVRTPEDVLRYGKEMIARFR
jgi:hypothetical protein